MKIKEFEVGQNLQGFECYVSTIDERVTKKDSPYVQVVLKDDTGEIGFNQWDTTKEDFGFKPNDVVALDGTVSAYKDKLQLNVRTMAHCDTPIESFFKHTEMDVHEMLDRLEHGHVKGIKNKFIKWLCDELIFGEHVVGFYSKAPAAKTVHHDWIGGLLEHSLGLCNMADMLYSGHYGAYFPTLDMDKVKFGCIFHDWGKVLEYDYSTPNIQYTKRGCLQHHMGIVQEALIRSSVKYESEGLAGEILVPHKQLVQELWHIIEAHHGSLEHGSSTPPVSVEALFVHHLDLMDSKMMHARSMVVDGIEGDLPGMSKKSWFHQTSYLLLPQEEGF